MQFSGIELSALVNMAIMVAGSDGEFADEEKAAIATELKNFGVKPSDLPSLLAASQALEAKDAMTIISLMNENQKRYVAAFLAVIIAADGQILDSEIRVWSLISLLCKLPKMNIQEGIKFWATH